MQYYVAESAPIPSLPNSWLPSTAAGVGTTTGGAGAIADDDNDQSTVLLRVTWWLHLTGNTFTYNLNLLGKHSNLIVVGPPNVVRAQTCMILTERSY